MTPSGRHHLILFEGPGPDPARDAYRMAVEEVLGRYEVETTTHEVLAEERRLHKLYGAREEARLFLIRPDGHVAYTGSPGDIGDLAAHMDGLFRKREKGHED